MEKTTTWNRQAYEARVASHIAIHAPKLTASETVMVAAVRAYLELKLRGANLRFAMSIFNGGLTNANDTVFVEKAQPREEWSYMFVGSMETLLCSRPGPLDLEGANMDRILAVFKAIKVEG